MRFVLLSLLVIAMAAVEGIAAPYPLGEWKYTGTKHGVELYKREVEGSDIIQLKGVGTLESPLWKVAATLLDTERAPEWVDSLEVSRVVKKLTPKSYIEYNHIGTPFVMKDRDFVSLVTIETNPKNKTFALIYQPQDEAVAPTDYIRGQILSGVFHLTALPEDKTLLTAEVHCDPKGSVAKWIVNYFQSSWAYDTFEALKLQLAKPNVRVVDEFKDVLLPTQAY